MSRIATETEAFIVGMISAAAIILGVLVMVWAATGG